MSSRKIRRMEAHKARKLERKNGLPVPEPAPEPTAATDAAAAAAAPESSAIPEPGFPFPALKNISPARSEASRINGAHGKGAVTEAGHAASSQNHTIHGLARYQNGTFKLLTSEDTASFESFKTALFEEHSPATETESILIQAMVESHWLAARAQRLQDTCINLETGAVTNEKLFSLYMRYQTTHHRAFHKSLNTLQKLRAEKSKAALGFEAQKTQAEKHEMKKQSHYWDILRKDAEACQRIGLNIIQDIKARAEVPGYSQEFAAELAKHGLKQGEMGVATEAAAQAA